MERLVNKNYQYIYKEIKKYILLTILIILTGIGTALSLKAAVGVGAWDALTQSLSFMSDIKVGTIGMILNCFCVIGQIIFLRKEFKWINLLQIPISILLGSVVNSFLYEILSIFTIDNYFINLFLLVCSYIYLSIIVGAIMTLDLVTFSLEGFCMAIANKTNKSFGFIRQLADILSIGIVILFTITMSIPLTIREGTIVSMLMLGPLLNFTMPRIKHLFCKWSLV